MILTEDPRLTLFRCYFAFFLTRSMAFVHFTLDRYLDGNSITWLWPLAWLPTTLPATHLWLGGGALISIIFIAILLPQFTFLRFAAALSVLILGAAPNSFGQVSHSDLSWIVISFIVAAMPRFRNISSEKFMFSAQAILLATYFSSGIWKAISFAKGIFSPDFFTKLSATVPDIIAHSVSGDGAAPRELALALAAMPVLSSVLWLLVLVFQLSTAFWLLRPNYGQLYGMALLVFHSLNVFILGFQFVAPMMLAVFLFFIWPNLAAEQFSRGKK